MHARLMIVDPLLDGALTLERLAHAQGWEVRTARSAGEALRTAGTFHPQVVLVALETPEDLWAALARRLRADLAGMLYVVGLSSTQPHAIQTTFPGVFDLALHKPLQPADLALIRKELSRRMPDLVFGP